MEQIGKIIGRRKYDALKKFDLEDLSEENIERFSKTFKGLTIAEGVKLIQEYEKKYTHLSEDTRKSTAEYFKRLHNPKQKKEKEIMTKDWLWKRFNHFYKQNEGVAYSKDKTSLENLKPIVYYFIGDLQKFKQCDHVSNISEPSLKKGLLIIGGYGNGKTSVMRAMENSLKRTNVTFKGHTSNEVVTMYEVCKNSFDKEDLNRQMKTGTLYFDDVLTERDASNYGKINLFKEILEERYNRNKKTYITCNYQEGSDNLEDGLSQFGEKYGSRVYDRLFSMFNIIEFKGKSFRK